MATLSSYISDCRNLIHDFNASDFTDATLTNFCNQARNRVALDTQCVQTYIAGFNTITQQEQYPLTGFVGGLAVKTAGTGYTNPTISITGGGGTGAAAIAVLSGGTILDGFMTNWGTGYTSAPTVVVNDPTGTGAVLTPVTGINIINWLQPVDILWGTLRLNFEYLPFIYFNAFCRAYAFLFSRSGAFTVLLGNQTVFLYPIPDQPYPMAVTAAIMPSPLVLTTDVDNQVIYPWSDAVPLFMAHLCFASLQNLEMANYWYTGGPQQLGKYDMRVRQLPASVTPYRIPNVFKAGRRMVRRM